MFNNQNKKTMEIKIFRKIVQIDAQASHNGYHHTITYSADVTEPKHAQIMYLNDEVCKENPDGTLMPKTSGMYNTYTYNGQNYSSDRWEVMPDIEEMYGIMKYIRELCQAIECGEMVMK